MSLVTGQPQPNLNGDLYTQLQKLASQNNYSTGINATNGLTYGASGITPSGEDAHAAPQQLGYESYDPNNVGDGQLMNLYDTQGNYGSTQRIDNGKYAGWWAPLAAAGAGMALGAAGTPAAASSGMSSFGVVDPSVASSVGGYGSAIPSSVTGGGGIVGTDLAPSTGGLMSGTGNSVNALDAATGVPYGSSAPSGMGSLGTAMSKAVSGITPGQALSGASAVGSALGGGSGISANTVAGIAGVGAGLYGANQQNQASNDMLNYLKGRQQLNDNMYAPGSPEYNALFNQMSAKDAAAGRNSQYGIRSVDLAGKIAQLKMQNNTALTGQIARDYANALNQRANSSANVTGPLGQLMQNGGAQGIANVINGLHSSDTTNPLLNPAYNTPDAIYGMNPSQINTNTDFYSGNASNDTLNAAQQAAWIDE